MIQNFAGMLLRWSPFKFMVQNSKVAYSSYTNIYYDLYIFFFFPKKLMQQLYVKNFFFKES